MAQSPLKLLWLGLALAAPGFSASARRIPVETFFGHAQIGAPAVSPDGSRVAFLAPIADRMSVVVFDLSTGRVQPVARAYDGDIEGFFWKGNERIVFGGDPTGRESPAIVAADLHGNVTVLAESLRENRRWAAFARLIDILPHDPAHILVAGRSSSGGWWDGLFRINVLTGKRESVFGADFETGEFHADTEGEVRFREWHAGLRTVVQIRANARSSWRPLLEFRGGYSVVDSPVSCVGFSRTAPVLFLTRQQPDGREAVYAYRTDTAEWGRPLFESNEAIGAVHLSWDNDRVEFITHGPEGRQVKWFDPRLEAIAKNLRAAFPGTDDIRIVSSDVRERVFVISLSSDRNPGAYYLLDLRGRVQLAPIGKSFPEINPEEMRPMQPISYRARDGLLIHGYLTLPAGASGRRVPLVLHPHGGPYGIRDYWGYNPEVQMLANRGYAVLQVNYRGSGGYGANFLLAGRRQWGRKMQDDLTDAVHWAIDQGIADPRRVCIYGASYGGYAALAGVEFTPDLYCCGINYVGLADLSLISNWQHEMTEDGRAYFHDMVGDDAAFIRDYSPINFVQNIRVPTLHAYGENDPRVVIQNWHELEARLKRYHKPYEYVYQPNQGHGFRDLNARIDFYRRMDEFLARNCPP